MLFHCGGGKGRAGIVAACYLVALGFAEPDSRRTKPAMSATEAVTVLRTIPAASRRTYRKSSWSSTAARYRKSSSGVGAPALSATDGGRVAKGCGSCSCWSGSLTRASQLSRRCARPRGWTYISQDETGSMRDRDRERERRAGALRLLQYFVGRTTGLARPCVALGKGRLYVCIWFDFDTNLCVSRAQNLLSGDSPVLLRRLIFLVCD